MSVQKLGEEPRNTEQKADSASDQLDRELALLKSALSRRSIFGRGMVASIAAFVAQSCSNSDLNASGDTRSINRSADKPTAPGNGTSTSTVGSTTNDLPDSDVTDSSNQDADGGTMDAMDGGDGIADIDGGDSGGDGKLDADGDADGADDIGTGEDTCKATTTNKIDPSKLPPAPADRVPAVRFYGRDNSAMVAMQFMNGDGIAQVIVCKEDGQLLALHGITGADAGGTRPIIIDNLFLNGVANIKLVIQMNDGKRYVTMVPKAYFKEFDSAAVTDLSDAPNPTQQSVAQFAEGANTFNLDPNVVYPNDFNSTQVRNLQTVKDGTTWTAQGGVKGIPTDIMGNKLGTDRAALSGSTIIEHPTFCTYSGNFRTMIRIG